MRCAVKNCKNNNKSRPCTISFYNFPSDIELLKQWQSFCCRDNNMNVRTSKICMEHFKPEDFENSLQFRMGFTKKLFLKRGVVPTVRKVSPTKEECRKARDKRIQNSKNKRDVKILIKEDNAESVARNELTEPQVKPISTEVFEKHQGHLKSKVLSKSEEREVHIKSEVLSEDEFINALEVSNRPVQPLNTEYIMESELHIKSEIFSEDIIMNTHDAKSVSANENASPMQSMETQTLSESEVYIKSEMLSKEEFINPRDAKLVSANVNASRMQSIETQTFSESKVQIKSDMLSKEEFINPRDAKSVSANVNVSSMQSMETQTFNKSDIHIKSEMISEEEFINLQESESISSSVNEPTVVQPMRNEISMESQFYPKSVVFSQDHKDKFAVNNDEKNKIKFLEMEIDRISKENSELRKLTKSQTVELRVLNSQFTKANYDLKNLEDKLLGIFSKDQIAQLLTGAKNTNWSEKDVIQAIILYATSSKFYKLLLEKHFPLPPVCALKSWVRNFQINSGLLTPVLELLSATTHMTDIDKICVLSFGEAEIQRKYCYDVISDTTLAPVSYVQVVMIRGLNTKWEQPIFYEYDSKMTVNILNNILLKLRLCGYTVAAIVSNLDDGYRALFGKLQVTEEKPWFTFEGDKVFVFADVPHIMKVLRNHFVNEGFLINGKSVRVEIISKLLHFNSGELNISHKISQSNLDVRNAKIQKVNLSTKLFSHTVAQAIMKAGNQGHLEGLNWKECYRLFKLTNDWFDMMNVKFIHSNAGKHCFAYGLSLETQNHILDKMMEMVREMRIIGQETLLPFQKGIIQSNNAIKGLYEYMMSKYNIKCLVTHRLNQDVLENFFEVMRSPKNDLYHNPDQLEFKYRLKSYVLGQNDSTTIYNRNVDNPDFKKCLTGRIIGVLNVHASNEEQFEKEFTDLQSNSLENLAGYICHKLKNDLPNIAVMKNEEMPTYSSTDVLPTPTTMQHIQDLDKIFESNNAQGVHIKKDFIRSLIEQARQIECDEEVKALFFRIKIYFKIKKLNQEIFDSTSLK